MSEPERGDVRPAMSAEEWADGRARDVAEGEGSAGFLSHSREGGRMADGEGGYVLDGIRTAMDGAPFALPVRPDVSFFTPIGGERIAVVRLVDAGGQEVAKFVAVPDDVENGHDWLIRAAYFTAARINARSEGPLGRVCDACGCRTVTIRGRYPGCEDRTVCPTCMADLIDQVINVLMPNPPASA